MPHTRPLVFMVVLATTGAVTAQTPGPAAPLPATNARTNVPYRDARPLLETMRADLLPPELTAASPAAQGQIWPRWVVARDREIRARVARGDEDSVVNLLLFGVTFTKRPRATERDLSEVGGLTGPAAIEALRGRMDDLVAGAAAPGSNERLQLVRDVFVRHGIHTESPSGFDDARRYVAELMARSVTEERARATAGGTTHFVDRGLSSDTSIFSSFAVEQTLAAMKADGALHAGGVRRVAIVGPGLDFIDKTDGYDFYPEQSIQPFAVIDSLERLGLAAANLRMTTFDVNGRINRHLGIARDRARAGQGYMLNVPRDVDQPWTPDLVRYWEQLGGRIGDALEPPAPPPGVRGVRMRSVRVKPAVVLSIAPRDLNIVLQRIEPLDASQRFDLVIATNILVYYGVFEQSLAMLNIAGMLGPRGVFLSNNFDLALPALPLSRAGSTDVVYTIPPDSSQLAWYTRR